MALESSTALASDSASTTEGRVQRTLSRLVGNPWTWVLFVGSLAGFQIIRAVTAPPPPEPPKVYYQVPDFRLTDQFSQPFGSEDLKGKIWVANFIFTHCPTRCEGLTEAMVGLQKHLRYMRDSVFLVSFSVDPEHDTPERLAAYATKHKAQQSRWRFLTGELDAVKEAVVKGFKLPMDPGEAIEPHDDEVPVADQLLNITHGTRLVLVDQEGQIRGYYEPDEAGIKDLLSHISLVSGFERVPGTARRFEQQRNSVPQ